MISCERTKGPNVETLLDEMGFGGERRRRNSERPKPLQTDESKVRTHIIALLPCRLAMRNHLTVDITLKSKTSRQIVLFLSWRPQMHFISVCWAAITLVCITCIDRGRNK